MAETASVEHPRRHVTKQGATPRCPHCSEPAIVRSSRSLSPIYREQLMQCTNALCGFTYVVGAEVIRAISPSAMPNPNVHIAPSTNPCAGVPRAANDQ